MMEEEMIMGMEVEEAMLLPEEVEAEEPIMVEPEVEPEPEVDEIEPEPEPEPEVEPLIGVVHDCAKLNVREEPNPKAQVIQVIEKGTKVLIDEAASRVAWYKVVLENGAEGFCMKQYIKIEE